MTPICCDICGRAIRQTPAGEGENHYHIYVGVTNKDMDFATANGVTVCWRCMPSKIRVKLGESYSFERVIRKFVKIDCPNCSYPRGVKNEHGVVKCGMCGSIATQETNPMGTKDD